jgi:hypothetical protein
LDETLNSDPCLRQWDSSPRDDANPMRRSRGSVRLDDEDGDEADEDADPNDDPVEEAPEAIDGGAARVGCASARGEDRRLLMVGTSTAVSVTASDTRLTTRR